jgi:FKBP-type peptidyl-prolyl cis-trans isomerase
MSPGYSNKLSPVQSTLIVVALVFFSTMLFLIHEVLSSHPSHSLESTKFRASLEVSTSLLGPESKILIHTLRSGTGPRPKLGDRVKIHYRGSFEDGTEFDSSYRKKTPLEFVVGHGRVIDGMDYGVQKIQLGSLSKIWIPWEMAYGANGYASVIPPKSNLMFEVELLSLEPSGMPDRVPDLVGMEPVPIGDLKVWTLREGEGKPASQGDILKVHFVGWLKNGDIFESSYFSEKPASYRQGSRAIQGWKEVMQIARASDILFVEIPPHLGYGPQALKEIPADSMLRFQIEILSIERKPTEEEQP